VAAALKCIPSRHSRRRNALLLMGLGQLPFCESTEKHGTASSFFLPDGRKGPLQSRLACPRVCCSRMRERGRGERLSTGSRDHRPHFTIDTLTWCTSPCRTPPSPEERNSDERTVPKTRRMAVGQMLRWSISLQKRKVRNRLIERAGLALISHASNSSRISWIESTTQLTRQG
jgi:hypothetical protein